MASRDPPPPSDHFDGTRFFNPGVNTDKSIADLWRWRRMRARAVWPPRVDNPPAPPPPTAVAANELAFTFIGQSTYLIRTADRVILTDPVFSERASPLASAGPRRVRPPGVALRDLPRVDIVLLSHNHYDHMDLVTLRALHGAWRPLVVTGLGNGAYLARKGVPGAIELDWWGLCNPLAGLRITYVPAQHWSSRTGFDRRRMLWGGHVVECDAGRIYFAGDTGYFGGFAQIRDRCGTPDVALLPIGAYEPRWFMKSQHMNPADAVRAHRDLGARLSLALHWGTFQLTDEAIDAPLQALEAAIHRQGVPPETFLAPPPGTTVRWRNPVSDAVTRFP